MAKITGALTGWKGKVGNIVFQMWKGVQVVKTRVIPENPQSPGQQTNRTLWQQFVAMFKIILVPLVHKFWNPFEGSKNSGWAKLIGANMLEQAGTEIDYEKVIISQGALPDEAIIDATYDDATGIVVCTWESLCGAGGSAEDFAQLCVYNKDLNRWCFDELEVTRADETATVTMSDGYVVSNLFIFLFFFTVDSETGIVTSVSNSDVKESVAPAV